MGITKTNVVKYSPYAPKAPTAPKAPKPVKQLPFGLGGPSAPTVAAPVSAIPPTNQKTDDSGAAESASSQSEGFDAVLRKHRLSRGNTIFAGEGGYRSRKLGMTRGTGSPTLG